MERPCSHDTNAELPVISDTVKWRGRQVSCQVYVNVVFGMEFTSVPELWSPL